MSESTTSAAPAEPVRNSVRTVVLWGLFSVALAGTAAWVVFRMDSVRLWYYEYKFVRAGDDNSREYWGRRMARLPGVDGTNALRRHALGDPEPEALMAGLVLSTEACDRREEVWRDVMTQWKPERLSAFHLLLLQRVRTPGSDMSWVKALIQEKFKDSPEPVEIGPAGTP